ncbi:hypothetical protein B484DRAFT_461051, partial [Ochromonadaceae sp. CCMP2298]
MTSGPPSASDPDSDYDSDSDSHSVSDREHESDSGSEFYDNEPEFQGVNSSSDDSDEDGAGGAGAMGATSQSYTVRVFNANLYEEDSEDDNEDPYAPATVPPPTPSVPSATQQDDTMSQEELSQTSLFEPDLAVSSESASLRMYSTEAYEDYCEEEMDTAGQQGLTVVPIALLFCSIDCAALRQYCSRCLSLEDNQPSLLAHLDDSDQWTHPSQELNSSQSPSLLQTAPPEDDVLHTDDSNDDVLPSAFMSTLQHDQEQQYATDQCLGYLSIQSSEDTDSDTQLRALYGNQLVVLRDVGDEWDISCSPILPESQDSDSEYSSEPSSHNSDDSQQSITIWCLTTTAGSGTNEDEGKEEPLEEKMDEEEEDEV